MIEEVLQRPELRARPPVLIDVGASGKLNPAWRRLAPYSICIAFDADERDFSSEPAPAHPYRTLYLHNNIVSDEDAADLEFHLTRSPYCSSALRPRTDKLAAWIFADLFDVQRTIRTRARTLGDILREHGLEYVDWFKTDSQGTDLRLFLSLGDRIVRRVLLASFEPGLIDAYVGEDKLHAVLAKMDQLPFWLHDMEVRGTQRLSRELWEKRVAPLTQGSAPLGLRTAPGWAEVTYLNTLENGDDFDRRDLLLAWVIACVNDELGFALELAERGRARFGDAIFGAMADESLARVVGPADRLLPETAKKAIRVLDHLRTRLLRR